MMTRNKKLFLNTSVSLLYQSVTLICGFILPRYLLIYYGSQVNGLVSSITQFLGFISLAECGVGAVVQSSLYKPLAEKNSEEISKIVISSEKFFHKIAILLLIYTGILMIIYPIITLESFDYFYTLSLIVVISISSFAQYYFSISYRLLLNADQMAFVQLGLQVLILSLNTIFSVILMKIGASIQAVKLVTSMLFLIQPIVLTLFVKKHYKLNKKLILMDEPIKQKWNGLAQHIAAVVLGSTDTVVLTLFSTLQNVSIYAVYHLVVNGVKQMILSLTTGMQAMLGNMYAKKETEILNQTFAFLEWMLHTITTFAFICTGILILPFVRIYTLNISDTNYIAPAFAFFISLALASYCLRLPYNMMVLAAGHYKQTQISAIIEAVINIVISVALVINFGLIGVAVGTLVAMLYRTIYLAWYLSQNILFRTLVHFSKHLIVNSISVLISILATRWIALDAMNYYSWIWEAIQVVVICTLIMLIMNFVFYRKFLLGVMYKCISGITVKLRKR